MLFRSHSSTFTLTVQRLIIAHNQLVCTVQIKQATAGLCSYRTLKQEQHSQLITEKSKRRKLTKNTFYMHGVSISVRRRSMLAGIMRRLCARPISMRWWLMVRLCVCTVIRRVHPVRRGRRWLLSIVTRRWVWWV